MTSISHDDEPQLLVAASTLLTRAGLSTLLEERGCLVLAQVDGTDLPADIDRYQPDALVIDLGFEGDAMRERLALVEADLPVLALIDADERSRISPLLLLMALFPQFALLLRDSDPDLIAAAVDALASGLSVIDPRLSGKLAAPAQGPLAPALSPLTARENDVLQLLARGLTNRAIALELGITQHTVKFHVNAIMSKLDVQSRTEAVVRATQLGLIVL